MNAPTATPNAGRRAVLSTPGSEPGRVAKALALPVDEVVVDLEDAVALDQKDTARGNVPALPRRAAGGLAVRVNAIGTPWHLDDVTACVSNPAVDSIVLPKAEDPAAIAELGALIDNLENDVAERRPLRIQALIESPAGVHHAPTIAQADPRLSALIIGYADLSASMGRRIDASWQFAQDAVLLAARMAGVQAIDGPLLTVADDEALAGAVRSAVDLGFDGKWVIHPRQIDTVQQGFTPSDDEVAEALEILAVLREAAEQRLGAVSLRGRMLDEAVAAQARRTVARSN